MKPLSLSVIFLINIYQIFFVERQQIYFQTGGGWGEVKQKLYLKCMIRFF